jgi:hypothetical protein
VLLGLLLNAAVTTACWIFQPNIVLREMRVLDEERSFFRARGRYLMHSVEWFVQFVPSKLPEPAPELDIFAQYAMADHFVIAHDKYDYGLPFRALRFHTVSEGRSSQIDRTNPNLNHTLPLWQRGLPTGLQGRRHHRFPTEPLPGFLYNTLIFTAAVLLASEAAARLRARSRRRRGRCPACAYDITGLPTCPECGQAIADPPPGHAHDESSNRRVPSAGALRDTN